MNGETYNLSNVRWDFFCSFTFRNPLPTEPVRIKMFFRWLRQFSPYLKTAHEHPAWVLRLERGEQTGREHLHALLTGASPSRVTVRTAFVAMRMWQLCGGGWSRVSVYRPELDGARYVVKDMLEGGKAYELGKFQTIEGGEHNSRALIRSQGLERLALCRSRVNRQRFAQLTKRDLRQGDNLLCGRGVVQQHRKDGSLEVAGTGARGSHSSTMGGSPVNVACGCSR